MPAAQPLPPPALNVDDAGLIRIGGQLLRLPPKERAVLGLLWQRRPAAVRKDAFAEAAWAGQAMSDESLARCISRVRRALRPWAWRIEAVYGLGYQLLQAGEAHGAPMQRPASDASALTHARQLLQQRTPAAVARAIELLRRLVQDTPGSMPARVALADALAVAVGWGQLATKAAVAEGLAALQWPGGEAEPGHHAARGALLDLAWRFEEAGASFRQALAHDADQPETLLSYARHLLYTDRAADAVAVLQRVRQLAPHALHPRMTLARALVQSGHGAAAVAEVQAATSEHPGQLVLTAFALSLQALVVPAPELEAAALRLTQGADAPPFTWTVASDVLARVGRHEASLDIVDTALLCSSSSAGEASLYAAPLAAMGLHDRAAALLQRAADERSGMLALVLRDPAHAAWLPQHPRGRALLHTVFGRQDGEAAPGPAAGSAAGSQSTSP